MHRPSLNTLRMFEIAGRVLNFRLAAEEANLTQGAVAQQVRKLESDLEVRLFDRHARGLTLTNPGFRYHQAISRGLSLIDLATEELLSSDEAVTVSMPPSFASKWLVPRLAEFEQMHPGISIEAIASEQLEDFRTSRIDFAIRQGIPEPERGLTVHHLAPVRLIATCSPSLAETIGTTDDPASLLEFPLIEDAHGHWASIAKRIGADMRPTVRRFNQTALALDAAAGGQGIVLAPDILAAADVSQNRLAIVWRDPSETGIWFHAVHRRDRRLTSNAGKVLDWIAAGFA